MSCASSRVIRSAARARSSVARADRLWRTASTPQCRVAVEPSAVASVVALMRVVSLNVNGIRAAVRRGLLGWVAARRPDLICLQEIRAAESQLPLRELEQLGYESVWNLGSRPGYSGVGILGRVQLEPVA